MSGRGKRPGCTALALSVLCSFLALSVSVSVLSGARGRGGREDKAGKEEPVLKRLNETLTNEMSDTTLLADMDRMMAEYMSYWQFHGVQLSVTRNDSLLFSKGWGEADEGVAMTPVTIMRVASVSKLVTATDIMLLQERGLLHLSDTVFGPHGILSDEGYTEAIKDRNYLRITVEDLLRHKGGFTTSLGDPMFSTLDVIRQNHLTEAPDHETLIKIILGRRLGYVPGTSQAYSNFGYLLLTKIIEKVSGQDYGEFTEENVLRPAGCFDFHPAENYYSGKYDNESRYYVPSNEPLVPEYNGSGRMVERCYGGNDIHALAGGGYWVASSAELARLVCSIDGDPLVPDILSEESVRQMTRYVDEETYSLGWNDTTPEKGWDRTGSYSGTSALVHRYPDGECWVFISNTSSWKGSGQARYTRELFRRMREACSAKFPKQDLFQ